MKPRLLRLLSLVMAFGLVAAACGGSSSDAGTDDTTEEETSTDDTTEEAVDEEAVDEEAMDDEEAMADTVALADICPSPLTVQTDWFPEGEHGAMYNLIGDDYVVDVDNKVVRGTMVGTDIEFEVRTGGPAIGFAPVSSYVYTDDEIELAYQNTEAQVFGFADTPMLAVVAPLEINPQMIMWDPETYPNVESIADLGTEGITINIFGGGTFADVFIAEGIWSADQVDPSYDGSPARFVSEGGAIAQQGFASAEPYTYEFSFEEWGKPVGFQLLNDAGFEVYAATIAIKPSDKDALDACLKEVVPMIQQSVVDYANSPERANAMIVDAVEQYADFWVYDDGLAAFSVAKQLELGLIGNGPDSTVGNIDLDRIQRVIDKIEAAGLDTGGVTAEDIVTNEYIDESIGL